MPLSASDFQREGYGISLPRGSLPELASALSSMFAALERPSVALDRPAREAVRKAMTWAGCSSQAITRFDLAKRRGDDRRGVFDSFVFGPASSPLARGRQLSARELAKLRRLRGRLAKAAEPAPPPPMGEGLFDNIVYAGTRRRPRRER